MMPRNDFARALMPTFLILLLVATTSGAEEWSAPRTADGHPDLQGIWANNGATPLERPKAFGDKVPDGPEDMTLGVRCITFGVPNTLAGYNSYFQFFQTADHVAILQELIHDVRIIPLRGGATLPEDLRLWHGDSHGRFEGDALIVETKNYSTGGGQ